MSKSVDLRASRSLAVVSELQTTAADFAEREEQLSAEFATKKFHLERKHRHVQEDFSSELEEKIAEIQSQHLAWEEIVHDIHEARRERITRAQKTGSRDLHKRAEVVRERWLGSLQVKKINIERKFTQSIKLAQAVSDRVTAALAERGNTILELDRKAKLAMSGYGSLRDLLRRQRAEGQGIGKPESRITEIDGHLAEGAAKLAEFKRVMLPSLFAGVGLLPMVLLAIVSAVVIAAALGLTEKAWMTAGLLGLGFILLMGLLWLIGMIQGRGPATAVADALAAAVRGYEEATAAANGRLDQELAQAAAAKEASLISVNAEWEKADQVKGDYEAMIREKLRIQVPRTWGKNDVHLNSRIDFIKAHCAEAVDAITLKMTGHHGGMSAARNKDLQQLLDETTAKWEALRTEWLSKMSPAYAAIAEMNASPLAQSLSWTTALADAWMPLLEQENAASFGSLQLDLSELPRPTDERLALPGDPMVSLPLALTFPDEGALLLETEESGTKDVVGLLNHLVFQLFAKTPPGKLAATIIDPVGLGQNFAGLMHFGDYEDSLINRRIWTQRDQIEERLSELNDHIEKVIQMYLRNEYASITEYNAQAGSTAEKYHFLVVADFPVGFSETAVRRLQSIATSGPRCGVFILIHWDKRQTAPDGLVAEELRKSAVVLMRQQGRLVLQGEGKQAAAKVVLDPAPTDEVAVALAHKIGKASIDSNRVVVPFEVVAPEAGQYWADDTTQELKVAIGRTGATKLQYLSIGKGTKQHALFAGKTGSGKSTLFHVIITNLALHCRPDQVEFYLIDFKKGVEFKCYATKKLPHARVIAIESDREFGLSVLQRVDDELKRRGDLFRKLGVQDVAGYKRAGGKEPIPRTLLMIDEFQEFFVDDDAIAQGASLLFDRIVRQGRAFGIHVLLGSQTLGGAYTLARATLGQMAIRVALQCNESDAYLIMDESNPAPRLLTRPGEGIYNDAAGALEGNSPFQVVWLPDEDRDRWLDKVHELAVSTGTTVEAPIVFEGNAPADAAENGLLMAALRQAPVAVPAVGRAWLGAPNSIKGPTEAAFQRQSGSHLLIVGQRDEAALAMLGMSVLSLAAQYPKGGAKFYLIHGAVAGSLEETFLEKIAAMVPRFLKLTRGAEIPETMSEITAIQKVRAAGDDDGGASIFLVVAGLQRFKKLRPEDEFSFSMSESDSANPAAALTDLITEGSPLGLHLITTVDTYNNVSRFLSRKALSEIEMRVLFQMSANDSATLIESPKASELGLHKAIFYNQQEGQMETFRPYALPETEWLAAVAASLVSK